MRITRLVLAEILGRPLNFLFCLAVVVVAAILFIVGPTMLRGYAADTQRQLVALQQETDAALAAMQGETDKMLAELDKRTTRIMRDMGVNLRIVHRDTKLGDLYTDFVAIDFPEDYVQKLATAPQVVTIVHLVATLQEKIKWNGRTVLLIGMFPVLTASQKNAAMQHMAQPVEPGTVVVGYELAQGLSSDQLAEPMSNRSGKLDAGDELEILGRRFRVAEVRPEKERHRGHSTGPGSPRCPTTGRQAGTHPPDHGVELQVQGQSHLGDSPANWKGSCPIRRSRSKRRPRHGPRTATRSGGEEAVPSS